MTQYNTILYCILLHTILEFSSSHTLHHSNALYSSTIYATALFCTLSHSCALTALYRTLLHSIALCCTLSHSAALCCTLLHSATLYRTLSYSAALCCNLTHPDTFYSTLLNGLFLLNLLPNSVMQHSVVMRHTRLVTPTYIKLSTLCAPASFSVDAYTIVLA